MTIRTFGFPIASDPKRGRDSKKPPTFLVCAFDDATATARDIMLDPSLAVSSKSWSFQQAVSNTVPAGALFVGNFGWPTSEFAAPDDATGRLLANYTPGPPGTKRDKPFKEQGQYDDSTNSLQVGYYLVLTPTL
jgi:hypothetical protein